MLSTTRSSGYRRVTPGARLRTLRRRLRGERRLLRYGNTTVWLAGRRSPVLFGLRRGRVRFVAVRDVRAVQGKPALRGYLSRARG